MRARADARRPRAAARRGSASMTASTSGPWRSSSQPRRAGPTCLTAPRYASSASSPTGSRTRTPSAANCQPCLAWPAKRAAHVDHLARAARRPAAPVTVTSSPSSVTPTSTAKSPSGQPPADGGDLQRELGSVGVLHRTPSVRPVWDNARSWEPSAPSSPRSSRRSTEDGASTRTRSSRCCTTWPSTARTGSWSAGPPARRRRWPTTSTCA